MFDADYNNRMMNVKNFPNSEEVSIDFQIQSENQTCMKGFNVFNFQLLS